MFTVIIDSEVPAVIGPFRSQARAESVAEEWNNDVRVQHRSSKEGGSRARVERLLSYSEAVKEYV